MGVGGGCWQKCSECMFYIPPFPSLPFPQSLLRGPPPPPPSSFLTPSKLQHDGNAQILPGDMWGIKQLPALPWHQRQHLAMKRPRVYHLERNLPFTGKKSAAWTGKVSPVGVQETHRANRGRHPRESRDLPPPLVVVWVAGRDYEKILQGNARGAGLHLGAPPVGPCCPPVWQERDRILCAVLRLAVVGHGAICRYVGNSR